MLTKRGDGKGVFLEAGVGVLCFSGSPKGAESLQLQSEMRALPEGASHSLASPHVDLLQD